MVSVGLEPVTVKSINGSVFIFVSFIMSLETSIIVSVSLFSKRSSSIQISSVPIFLKGFLSSTISSVGSITSVCFFFLFQSLKFIVNSLSFCLNCMSRLNLWRNIGMCCFLMLDIVIKSFNHII